MICGICNHYCDLQLNETGKCKIIKNIDGQLKNTLHGLVSILSMDVIEKRPFFHFYPNRKYLSTGSASCNFFCQYCFNESVSQNFDTSKMKQVSPQELVEAAIAHDADGIVFTYNEPSLFHEYIREVEWIRLSLAQYDLKLAIKTNGFCGYKVLRDLLMCVDAFNVDVKGDEKEYERIGGRLQPVLDNIKHIHKSGVWLEISYLVADVKDFKFHQRMTDYFASIDINIPIHILYMFPFHNRKETYEKQELFNVYSIFKAKMKYVYLSNLFGEDYSKLRNTYCDTCKSLLIARDQGTLVFKTECCSKKLAGIW